MYRAHTSARRIAFRSHGASSSARPAFNAHGLYATKAARIAKAKTVKAPKVVAYKSLIVKARKPKTKPAAYKAVKPPIVNATVIAQQKG